MEGTYKSPRKKEVGPRDNSGKKESRFLLTSKSDCLSGLHVYEVSLYKRKNFQGRPLLPALLWLPPLKSGITLNRSPL